jgi:hypothetical protein
VPLVEPGKQEVGKIINAGEIISIDEKTGANIGPAQGCI